MANLDFVTISHRLMKNGTIEVYPKFIIKKSKDLMIRGGDFYAVWVESRGLWSTDEQDAMMLIDEAVSELADMLENQNGSSCRRMYLWDAETGMIDSWHKYCQKQMRDNFHILDSTLTFNNTITKREDYSSKRLSYPIEPGPHCSYDKLMSTLYSVEERTKIEWAIGSIISGDSRNIQKFMVLYGSAGTGKSTVLNIIQKLFEGYYSVFDAKALGSSSNSFALESFKSNPLVAIQHDGDLSKIEDNTRLNSLVSHERMTVNEKFKSAYSNEFQCFLFMGTNKPVKITDAKSGIIRRLIDVSPSGNRLNPAEYKIITKQIDFELGSIADYCKNVYLENPGRYDSYVPLSMMSSTNDFYNFVLDSYYVFKKEDGITLKSAWEMYNNYCDYAKVPYPYTQRLFKEELKNYFENYIERFTGEKTGPYYTGFKYDIFDDKPITTTIDTQQIFMNLSSSNSIFDRDCSTYPAQYATDKGIPMKKWIDVTTNLSDLDTRQIHYVKMPENHIVIDFDIPGEDGNKCLDRNLEEASKWPPTYAELSKSGSGVHLHYIYSGDPTKLSKIYDDHIEVKVFTGNSSLRRKLTKCNDLPIATINSGLPLKGEDKLVNFDAIKSEKVLRTIIKRNLNKEIHPATKPSIDFIYKVLEDAYSSGLKYDVSDMAHAILSFASNSTHQAEYCIKLVNKMHFKSDDISEPKDNSQSNLVFYDVEVFPNLFLVSWKIAGKEKPVIRMINPSPSEIEDLMRFRLVGFNCRKYDNHILYARMMGYTNEQLYNLSQRIINKEPGCFFGEAYNVSYTDVYDFASAGNKQSLKKFEIELGIHHQELGIPWYKPVPEELWMKVAEYCDNDVIATEATFEYLSADWTARQILADLAEMTVNDTTNSLTTRIIFGKNRKPQSEFCYRDLSQPVYELDIDVQKFLEESCPEMMSERHGECKSILPYFPGYTYDHGVSTYRGEEAGEGGYVYAEPGMYGNVALLDIASMHPHSTIAECLFGPKFTQAFRDIVEGRVSIKHESWDIVNEMLDGKLKPYIQQVLNGDMTSKELADALKTAINSVYGLTAAKFDNPFRDIRNKDNIVAKRGALFMIDLKHEVQKRGFKVAHIKTDSIKIPDATPDIIQFVMDFGKKYGYTFEHEATYERMCLVNNAVYIAKYKDGKHAGEWTATGTQFQVPYVFKTLFSKEPIEFKDLCETKSVTSALYLDINESLPDVSKLEQELFVISKDNREPDRQEELKTKLIPQGHNYKFIGKVGLFCPIRPGCGGGRLVRENLDKNGNIKYDSATGADGYRWLESEMVKTLGLETDIDKTYYKKLADSAIDEISKYGDFNWFVSDDPYIPKSN